MHEMACSSMHKRFIPDSDSVYKDKGAVSLHDNVVTVGLNVWVTSDIHSAHNTWGGLTMWLWSHSSGRKNFVFLYSCPLTSIEWIGGCIHCDFSGLPINQRTTYATFTLPHRLMAEAVMQQDELLIRVILSFLFETNHTMFPMFSYSHAHDYGTFTGSNLRYERGLNH